ncbi:MAG: TIGR02757 family protein, partial [Myxococcota bacterium]
MKRAAAAPSLPPRRLRALAEHLAAVERVAATPQNLARDPVRFPRAYRDAADIEIAAVLSAQLAYG